jgi:spermidine synthase
MSLGLARTLVFFTSAAVLVIELLATRLLAPYLGISLLVFTGVLGVILAGISAGAWAGGRLADTYEPRSLLGPILAAGGVTAMTAPLLVDWVGPALSAEPVSIVFASAVSFFVPAAVLSAVPPIVVKIRLASLAETGTVVGSFSAVGTAGAIFGSFLTGFFLVAAFPTRPILLGLGIVLVLAGTVMWRGTGRGRTGIAIVAVAVATLLAAGSGPCQMETAYHCVIVEVDDHRDTGRILVLDRLLNSYVDLEDPTYLEFRYIRLIADIVDTHDPDPALRTVSIGGGGMTLPAYFDATRPDSAHSVLEIDGRVVDLALTEFGMDRGFDIRIEDARISLREMQTGSADVVVGDAYTGASVPWHLTTVEYTSEIRRVLDDDGVYAMNVVDFRQLRFARSAARSLLEVFDHVALFVPESYLDGRSGGNFVFVASTQPFDTGAMLQAVRARGGVETVVEGDELARFAETGVILRDDYAPVDQMLTY